ncbi:hypothetical protein RchiOBHm_Chr2g0126621 [Rosa chinensis]|uniref:Uncharacterized protein n=1 Tax=Rosa chinensis TaxID=74649 RepID=A0A2P6RTV3_ROSCH|nr:uncharacterized protein LOC112187348 [Rosa chinensis]PRQ49860.1 hypothetical protein RchiOBHm_Chr2g0126621 [Rosa chinensis]
MKCWWRQNGGAKRKLPAPHCPPLLLLYNTTPSPYPSQYQLLLFSTPKAAMVLKLKLATPAKFYGSSLPRPRIYTDVKFNDERVDPPVAVMDPFLAWANEAHWSMGGLSFKRLRLQGRIEGHVGKLRAEREKTEDRKQKSKRASSDSPPSAPIAPKRRRFLALIDEDEDEEEEEEEDLELVRGKRLVKKLADEFDRVADAGKETVASRTRSRKLEVDDGIETETQTVMQVAKEVNKLSLKGKKLKKRKSKGPRTSPRLANRS